LLQTQITGRHVVSWFLNILNLISTESRYILGPTRQRVAIQMCVILNPQAETVRLDNSRHFDGVTVRCNEKHYGKSVTITSVSYPLSHVYYGCLGRFGDRIPPLSVQAIMILSYCNGCGWDVAVVLSEMLLMRILIQVQSYHYT
jgi:hypothetical protein